MDELQKRLLDIIQAQFPIKACPFAALADQLDCSESEIISQIDQLQQAGIIRRIGAIFNAAHLGYVSTLVAAQVPQEKLDGFVTAVNAIPGVSHNYGRAHRYNIWFTLTADCQESIDQTIERLRKGHNISAIYSLPAEKMFKIKVDFDFASQSEKQQFNSSDIHKHPTSNPSLSALQIDLIRQLQRDLPVIPEPFESIAEEAGINVDSVLEQIRDWKKTGLIRRFGASIRHQKVGFNANGMVVFEIEPQRLIEAGRLLAQYAEVSHCYQRPTAKDWPYNLFAMTHCQTEKQLHDLVNNMVGKIEPIQYDILLSTVEYKKTHITYFAEPE